MKPFISLATTFTVLAISNARACDLCSAFAATEAEGLSSSGWSASLATQFTHFSTLRIDGDKIPNDADQRLDSTTTQLVVSRAITPRFAVQLNVPMIVRDYRRPEAGAIEHGHESGFGDISLLGRFILVRRDLADTTLIWSALGGVKFPTGNTRRIAEELAETPDDADAHAIHIAHAGHDHGEDSDGPESGIHGHDLTLGTGSTDGIVGTNLYVRHARFLATASLQYTLRSRGDYDYRFANDLTWEVAPGAYLVLAHKHTLAFQVVASGEHKGMDDFAGAAADDTGINAAYLGPRLAYTRDTRLSSALGADFPIRIENTALQLTPTFRLRANVTWNF